MLTCFGTSMVNQMDIMSIELPYLLAIAEVWVNDDDKEF